MIKLSKKVAFAILVLVTILLAISVTNINWDIFYSKQDLFAIFREIRESLIFIILAIFYINYYVKVLKSEN